MFGIFWGVPFLLSKPDLGVIGQQPFLTAIGATADRETWQFQTQEVLKLGSFDLVVFA